MACTLCIQISFSHKLARYWGPRGQGRAALGTWPHSEGGTPVMDIRSQIRGNTWQHSHLLIIRTCRNSSLSLLCAGWPHSLASQVSNVGECGAGADGSIPCYTVLVETGDTDSVRDSISQHLEGDTLRLGITLPHWAWHIDTAANNPSHYDYIRAKYGLWLWQGLERASKNAPTTQS